MVIGIGADIIEISRMESVLERHETTFVRRVFTENERGEAAGRALSSGYYAGRWAVKEAVAKALGTGIGPDCGWLDVDTRNGSLGRPQVRLAGAAARRAAAMGVARIHVSISHERNHALAMVVLEGE